ncbi:MAG: hypothetical protein IPM27_05395 [Nitrosomonadales bacterium]|nr:hypothetical protein [Nitrosomonadales bacterium]
MPERKTQSRLLALFAAALLAACASTEPARNGKSIPRQADRNSLGQFGKTDYDHLADVAMRENTQSLHALMVKLYKRNPRELRKRTTATAEEAAQSVFENTVDWRFGEINGAQGTDAIQQAFRPDFTGDRVLSLIVGMQTMLVKAHGGKSEFYLTDTIEPQNVYNAARNIEIAVWKLSNARDETGQRYLLTNELNDNEQNLSFEREFGKVIGRLDLHALTLSEKLQRSIVKVVQALASALFLPY